LNDELTALEEDEVIQGMGLYADLMQNEHRGVRSVCVESLVQMAQTHLNDRSPKFADKVQQYVENFVQVLVSDHSQLYRRVSNPSLSCPKKKGGGGLASDGRETESDADEREYET
jgi:hypothetical protein